MTTPALAVEHLAKAYGGLQVTRDVNFALAPGERVALIGPNGAGKSTLVDLICGVTHPDAGRVRLFGRDVTGESTASRTRRGLVRTFQVSRLVPDLTATDHVRLAGLARAGAAMALRPGLRADAGLGRAAAARLAALGLDPPDTRPVSALAYGERRLVDLAMALALKPRVLLLDEPAAGVPAGEVRRIEAALAALPDDLAVLLIDHDLDLVFRFARRVIVLAAGAVIFDGLPDAAARADVVRAAYLGSRADGRL